MGKHSFIAGIQGYDRVAYRPSIASICRIVSLLNSVNLSLMMSGIRQRPYAHARQEVFRRAYYAGYSLTEIGDEFGLDHTTILHGIRAAEKRGKAQ
jgi:chromosomal replication initiation ATPase DnaA